MANGYKLFTAAQVKAMRKWVEFSARAGKPDGMLPGIGDEPGRPLHHLFGAMAAPIMESPRTRRPKWSAVFRCFSKGR